MKVKLSGYYKLPQFPAPIEFDFDDVFDTTFMKKYTRYKNFSQFLNNGRFNISCQKDFEDLPEEKMNVYVAKTTKFVTWQEMIDFSTERYIKKSIGKAHL